MKLHSVWRIAALALVIALVVGVAPAFAYTGTGRSVTADVTYVNSAGAATSLSGMSDTAVYGLITDRVNGTTKPEWLLVSPLNVTYASKSFSFNPNDAITVDAEAMVAQALNASAPTTVTAVYKVQPAVVNAWVSTVAKSVNVASRDAKRVLKKKRLTFVKERSGLAVDRSATAKAITSSLTAALATPSTQPAAVTAVVKTAKPKVTAKNIKKEILVVLAERKIYLYKGTKLEKKFGCAIGMPGHATPTGHWKIVAKNPHPAWRNPAPNGWGKNMPAYIAPGPRNPLGVRALYLNASGIRIHGTYKYWSIGHAASHGCMRMRNSDIKKLYPLVPVGTPVTIIK